VDQLYLPLNNDYHYDWNGSSADAYVIDTGILSTHVDFGGRVTCGINFVRTEDCEDYNGHGTHVSGTIGGTSVGVAKLVNLITCKVLNSEGSGAFSDVIGAIDYVVQAASKSNNSAVANLSLGGGQSRALNRAVNYRRRKRGRKCL
jgi:serine protease